MGGEPVRLPVKKKAQEQFVHLVEEGRVRTLMEAAPILGVTPATIYNYAKQTGVTIPKTGRRRDAQQEFVQLVKQGRVASLIEAATILGLSRQTIYKYAEQTSVTLKGRTGVPGGWRSLRTKQVTGDLRRLVDEGKVSSKAEAARVLGVSINLVSQILLDAELEIPIRKAAPPSCRRLRSPSDETRHA